MKFFIFSLLLFYSSHLLSAQTEEPPYAPFDWIKINPLESYEDFAWEKLPRGITQLMVESLLTSPYITSEDHITLFYVNEQLLAVLSCRFEVLRWTGDRWENLYLGTSSGFNCNPHFFVREGRLYSLGGYGFWKGHSELLIFDFEIGFWEPVAASSPPTNYGGVGIFVEGDRIVSILGQYIHQPSKLHQPEKNGYVFDFKSQSWRSLTLDFPSQSPNSYWDFSSFDLKDYGILLYQFQAYDGLLLFHKKENALYFADDSDYGKFKFLAIAVALGNEALVYDKFGNLTPLLPEKDLLTRFKKVGTLSIAKPQDDKGQSSWVVSLLLGIGMFFLVGGILWWRKNQKNRTLPEEESSLIEERIGLEGEEDLVRLIDRLLTLPELVVDVHQLDDLLGTSSLESLDYRRVRRSRYIKAINQHYQVQHGKELIVRTKSEVDKRIILYRIFP